MKASELMTNSEKLEQVEEEIFRIGEAIEQLEGVRGMEDVIGQLRDCAIVLGFEKDQYFKLVRQEEDREDAALTREYYAAVL
jgi:hypothetical protein